MWIADRWKDYEVLDCSGGEKLERWGDWRLIRPDPQVIWNTEKKNSAWRRPDGHYHRSSKGGGEWEFFGLPKQWEICYELPGEVSSSGTGSSAGAAASEGAASSAGGRRLTFRLKPFSFKHTGLFPEQAANWDWFSSLIARAVQSGRSVKVLNLFAYTGGATLAAAAAGAAVTHVDASKGMVSWAKENAAASGLENAPIRWLVDDCAKFVQREMRRGNRYDAIIMDPPSYGRGPNKEIWKIEDAVFPLIKDCASLLSDQPLFFLINSYTTGLQAGVLTYMLGSAVAPGRGGTVRSDEIGLPVSGSGLVLPCGASGRWEAEVL
ncbi:MAG: class I SAM-dependent methyltransferase [Stomatobaculum sp.]|nr:class I SAM-dependent methyltransferase [Stomatobaculum sp.]